MKIYADRRDNAQERNITPGEIVLIKQPKQNKLSTPYNPKTFVEEKTKGAIITVRNGSVVQDSGVIENVIETPPTDDKTQVELLNSDEPRKNNPLRRSQRQLKPFVRFSDYEHA